MKARKLYQIKIRNKRGGRGLTDVRFFFTMASRGDSTKLFVCFHSSLLKQIYHVFFCIIIKEKYFHSELPFHVFLCCVYDFIPNTTTLPPMFIHTIHSQINIQVCLLLIPLVFGFPICRFFSAK